MIQLGSKPVSYRVGVAAEGEWRSSGAAGLGLRVWVVGGRSLCVMVPYGVGNPRHKNLVSGPKYVGPDMHVDQKSETCRGVSPKCRRHTQLSSQNSHYISIALRVNFMTTHFSFPTPPRSDPDPPYFGQKVGF